MNSPVSSSPVVTRARRVERSLRGQPTSDGAGVKLTRLLTQDLQRRLDPYLMLDAFGSDTPGDYIAGFPEHPHRGFETVTYMLAGRMRHRDSAGNEGLLTAGGVQWMTAGRGLIHSEMPEQESGTMEGFQLWLNLPAEDKLCPPWYRDFPAREIPIWQADGATVRVIAGEHAGMAGAVQRVRTAPLLLDVHLAASTLWTHPLPASRNAFLCVYRGGLECAGSPVASSHLAILSNEGDGVVLTSTEAGARFLLIAGEPLNEPIAQHGPFVMNTRQQLIEAVDDFRAGRLGQTAAAPATPT